MHYGLCRFVADDTSVNVIRRFSLIKVSTLSMSSSVDDVDGRVDRRSSVTLFLPALKRPTLSLIHDVLDTTPSPGDGFHFGASLLFLQHSFKIAFTF